jgi:hypothetical protein
MKVVPLQVISDESKAALDDMITKATRRYQNGEIRTMCILTVDHKGEWYQAHFNSTVGDEAYMIALLQARLLKRINE